MGAPYDFPPALLTANRAIATSLTDIPDFSQNVITAGGLYRFKVFMDIVTVGTTNTLGFSMGGTLTELISGYSVRVQLTAAGTNEQRLYTAIPGAATLSAAVSFAGHAFAEIEGFVKASAGGTLTVQGIRAGATSATIQAGSAFLLSQEA
jgi:hypothetical protein